MPIVHFVNSKNQTAGGMKSVLNYVSQERKTAWEDRKFVSGINCSPQSVCTEMMMTKRLYKKNSGRLYYHLVQSFPKGYEISPELAHKIAVEFAEKAFGKYECIVATHIDREHIHSHFVFNSVSFEDGRKYHSNLDTVKGLMKLSDEICLKYGVSTLDSPDDKFEQKKSDTLSDREYRSADKGESWKFQLIAAITECMKEAKSKKQFAYLMKNRYGYGVRWEDNRKHITYTTPNGYKCRDKRLHDDKFLKEAMEREFEIRYELLNGKNRPQLQQAVQPVTMTAITEQNWLAVVGVLTDVVQSQDNVIKILSGMITAEQMNIFIDNQITLSEQSKTECRDIQNQISASTSTAMQELLSQAGKMSEEYSLRLKEQDEWRQRLNRRLLKAVVISQSTLLILSAALQICLR